MTPYTIPVGWLAFHENNAINFQLNRWHSAGLARKEDLETVAAHVQDFSNWKQEMLALAERAQAEERWLNAATYVRAAIFFARPDDPDRHRLYDECIRLFDQAYRDLPLERFSVPYPGTNLPGIRLYASGVKKGTLLLHGGYDSFSEEFVPIMTLATARGWEVVMFEGPGQAGPLHRCGQTMTPEWEHPTRAVIDYLGLDKVNLIGVSLGGYLALRAAAFEPRIERVVAFDLVWDFYAALQRPKPLVAQVLTDVLRITNARGLLRRMETKLRQNNLFADWLLSQGYAVFGVSDLLGYLKAIKHYSTRGFSHLIRADVLLLAGEDDLYTPFLDVQRRALYNARSVTTRLFTRAEHASHHCQVGNLPLALKTMLDWFESRSNTA